MDLFQLKASKYLVARTKEDPQAFSKYNNYSMSELFN